MSETKQGSGKGIGGWIKAAIASIVSAIGGAVLIYASPLLDTVIKPAKPIANFQAQANGLTVTFQNKSTGGQEGWWDFGDGSALEPYDADDPAITHTYARSATYTVRLTLKNIIHEENDRVAMVTVDAGNASPPIIETFEAVAVRGEYAPAAFRVVAKVKNADMCVWALGDRPLEFSPETAKGEQKRVVTFKEPGTHVLRLAAFNGKLGVEKTQTIVVQKAPVGIVTATVAVAYEAVLIEQLTTRPIARVQFPADQKGNVATVSYPTAADLGFEIVKAEVVQPVKDPNVKSANVQIDPKRRDRAVLTCELLRQSPRNQPPVCVVQMALTQQRQSSPTVKIGDPVSVILNAPGPTLVPMPSLASGWVVKKHKTTLAMQQDGKQIGFFDGTLPQNATVILSGAAYSVTAVEQAGQLRIDVVQKGGGK